jgi:ABC-type antimicrobial peptide transport system permease subunit
VRAEVLGMDRDQPITNVNTMRQRLAESTAERRFQMLLFGLFGGAALILAAIGIYGVMSYTVSQRTREIGLRMALGAAPARVRAMVLRQVGLMTLVGGVIGLAASVGLARVAQSLLFQMQGSDPAVLAGSAIALTLVALGAGFIPAHRASQVDPMSALRYE